MREVDDVDGIHLLAALADQLLDGARVVLVDDAVARRAGAREQQTLTAVLDVCTRTAAGEAGRMTDVEREERDIATSANRS